MTSEKTYKVELLECVVPYSMFLKECIDVPRFLACCRECPSYGKQWTCPPFDFDPMKIWKTYTGLRLYARVITMKKTDLKAEEAYRIMKEEKNDLLIELLCKEQETKGSLVLSAGTCEICETGECGRRKGIPCRYPQKMRYSIEALGGNVGYVAEHYLKKTAFVG